MGKIRGGKLRTAGTSQESINNTVQDRINNTGERINNTSQERIKNTRQERKENRSQERIKNQTQKSRIKNTRKRRGEVAESVFLAKAVSMGFGVAKPWGDSERYDFILDSGGELWRVQLKSAYVGTKEGGYTVHAYGNEHSIPYTAAELDVVVAYVAPEDAWYVIPIQAFAGIKGMKVFPASRRMRSKYERYRGAWCWLACGKGEMGASRLCAGATRCSLGQWQWRLSAQMKRTL